MKRKKGKKKATGPGPEARGTETRESSAPSPSMEEELSRLQGENASLGDKLARALADMANIRRRLAEDSRRARENSILQVAGELLPALDSLDLALRSGGSREELQKGVEMVQGMILDLLGRQGLERIEADGKPFDPRIHEAILVQESSEVEGGTVLSVHQEGYRIGDRILRPSRVVVSRKPGEDGGSLPGGEKDELPVADEGEDRETDPGGS